MKALESNSDEDIEELTDNIINDTGNDMTNLTVWAANVMDKVNQSMQLKSNEAEKDQVAELSDKVNQSTKLNASKLTKMIMKPLTQEEESQLNRVINDTKQNPSDTFVKFRKEKVSWGSMKNLSNDKEGPEIKDHDKWINDQVVNYYCHNFLANEDKKRCEKDFGESVAISSPHTFMIH